MFFINYSSITMLISQIFRSCLIRKINNLFVRLRFFNINLKFKHLNCFIMLFNFETWIRNHEKYKITYLPDKLNNDNLESRCYL